tara:strand:+ start:154 stop:393 length:240 start_codon:yes stop_codon:yes gene_type:complete
MHPQIKKQVPSRSEAFENVLYCPQRRPPNLTFAAVVLPELSLALRTMTSLAGYWGISGIGNKAALPCFTEKTRYLSPAY